MKKQRKPIATYCISSLLMYGYTFIFSIAALVFLIDKIPAWVQIVMGPLFLAPVVVMYFFMGKKEGEALYKSCTTGTLIDIHDKAPVKVPLYKMVYHVLGFAVPLIILALIAGLARVGAVRGILSFLLMPITVFFIGTGAVDFAAGVGLESIYIFVPFILAFCVVFCVGFYIGAMKLKRQQGEIESELRSFDN